jgi:rhamnogalacturonan acetylesterase
MQFGHNDSSPVNEAPPVTPSTRARGTIPGNGEETQEVDNILTGKHEVVHTYGWYLRHFITTAKAKGAVAIVCSPIPRNSWQKDGTTVKRANTNHGLWAKQAAEQEHAFFVDLNEIIARDYEKLGKPAVDPFFADKVTHTTLAGAQFNARAVVSGLNGLDNNPLAFALSAEGKAMPAFRP